MSKTETEHHKRCDYLPKMASDGIDKANRMSKIETEHQEPYDILVTPNGIEEIIEDSTSDEDDQESLECTLDENDQKCLDCTSDEKDQKSLECTLDEDDQKILKANRMSLSKISSKETIENQIEGNGKEQASVEKELNLKAETTIVKKKDMEEEVQRNTERKESLEKELNPKAETTIVKKKDMEEEVQRNTERKECLEKELGEIRRSKETITDEHEKKIKALEEEIRALKKRNEELEKQLQEMDKELQEMDKELQKVRESLKKIEKENKEKDEKIEKLRKDSAFKETHNESVLILVQIGKTLQINRCKYVLGKDFKEAFFYEYENIDRYIRRFVPARAQESAKKRRKELDEKCPWDQDLVDSLKHLKGERNTIAHPELSSENIQKATKYLRGMNEITDEMVENIMGLKALWETSEDLLRRRSAPEL